MRLDVILTAQLKEDFIGGCIREVTGWIRWLTILIWLLQI